MTAVFLSATAKLKQTYERKEANAPGIFEEDPRTPERTRQRNLLRTGSCYPLSYGEHFRNPSRGSHSKHNRKRGRRRILRIEAAGAQITDAVIEVLDTLQNQPELRDAYIETIDEVSRAVILDLTATDSESDARTLSRLRALQMIRRDILTLASPPDVDLPENDTPTAQL